MPVLFPSWCRSRSRVPQLPALTRAHSPPFPTDPAFQSPPKRKGMKCAKDAGVGQQVLTFMTSVMISGETTTHHRQQGLWMREEHTEESSPGPRLSRPHQGPPSCPILPGACVWCDQFLRTPLLPPRPCSPMSWPSLGPDSLGLRICGVLCSGISPTLAPSPEELQQGPQQRA